ncbi:MAG: hypothetical protein ACRD0Y_00280 [Terriglobales bacterium]
MATTTAQQAELMTEGWEEFLELETKIHRVAEALQQARAERDRAQADLSALQAAHEKLLQGHSQNEHELVQLRKERHEVRQRIARLSKQLEGAET